jgi:hypothetical protein
MSRFDYDMRVEIYPGFFRLLRDCHEDDLQLAMDCQLARNELHDEAEKLLAAASHRNLDIPGDLRERLGLWTDSLLDAVSLVDELRDSVLVPA